MTALLMTLDLFHGVLKHPLVRADDARVAWLGDVRRLDLALRGVRPGPGLSVGP